jgi:diguanylate cyclase (GGDEF)-like protein
MLVKFIPLIKADLREHYRLACNKNNLDLIWHFSFVLIVVFGFQLFNQLKQGYLALLGVQFFYTLLCLVGLLFSLLSIVVVPKLRDNLALTTGAIVLELSYPVLMAAICIVMAVKGVNEGMGPVPFVLGLMTISIVLQGHFVRLLLLLIGSLATLAIILWWVTPNVQFFPAIAICFISILLCVMISHITEQARIRQFEAMNSLNENNLHLLQLTNQDPLTGLHNRRSLEQVIDKEIARSRRYGKALSLLMIDVDDFKAINDQFGHLVGDAVLKDVAMLIEQQVREIDEVCRFGGEEFVVLLVEADFRHSVEIAERIREAIEDYVFLEAGRAVTVSIGHVQFARYERQEFVENGDNAMYQAKKQGKNRVISYLPPVAC